MADLSILNWVKGSNSCTTDAIPPSCIMVVHICFKFMKSQYVIT